jgi:hypothetical protein
MTIETSIPIPPRRRRFGELDQLEVGQSAAFPMSAYFTLCASIMHRQTRYGKQFTRRREGDSVRVWRVS